MIPAPFTPCPPALSELQHRFDSFLPPLLRRLRKRYRRIRCPHDRDDAISVTLLHAWKLFCKRPALDLPTLLGLALHRVRRSVLRRQQA